MGREAKNSGRLIGTLANGYGPDDKAEAERRAMLKERTWSTFRYPGGHVARMEILSRRLAWSRDPRDAKLGKPWYLSTLDLVRLDDGREMIRIGYYRVFPGPRLVWGAQTTACFPREVYADLGVEVRA